MSEPTTRFRLIPNATDPTAIDTPGERTGAISGEQAVSTGAGNEADFGLVDISGGAANSSVLTALWDVTADGGNTLVENFKLWLSTNGFDVAGSVAKFRALSGTDNSTPSNTENYQTNAITSTYAFGDMPEAEPDENLWPTDEGTSMDLSTTSDDAILWAMYLAIADGETTGTYAGLTAGYELQFSFKYSYS